MANLGGLSTDLTQTEIQFDPPLPDNEHTMMVATCNKCRGWYSMDYEPALPDDHFDMRTGEPCHNEYDWSIDTVPYREDWREAK